MKLLEIFCAAKGFQFEVITDIGSGMNLNKKGLSSLVEMLLNDEVERLVIVENVEVVIINSTESKTFDEELASDELQIITVFLC